MHRMAADIGPAAMDGLHKYLREGLDALCQRKVLHSDSGSKHGDLNGVSFDDKSKNVCSSVVRNRNVGIHKPGKRKKSFSERLKCKKGREGRKLQDSNQDGLSVTGYSNHRLESPVISNEMSIYRDRPVDRSFARASNDVVIGAMVESVQQHFHGS